MGVNFTTITLPNGKETLGSIIILPEDSKDGIIVTDEDNKAVIAMEIDWENRKVIPAFVYGNYNFITDCNKEVKIK